MAKNEYTINLAYKLVSKNLFEFNAIPVAAEITNRATTPNVIKTALKGSFSVYSFFI